MKFFSNIPRGLTIFIAGIVVVIVLIAGYEFLRSGSSTNAVPGGGNFFSSLFPFGKGSSAGSGNGGLNTAPLTETQSGAVPILREISAAPVAGAWFASGLASTSAPVIRYMDRASGHVLETPADSFQDTRISNTTIPGVEELYPVNDSTILISYFNDAGQIENFLGVVNATSSEQSLNGTIVRRFDHVAVAPGGSLILTVTAGSGGSRVDVSKPNGTTQTLFTSAFTSWVPLVSSSKTFLETSPTGLALGYLYEITNGGLQKIAGGIPGFVATVSPSGQYAAYSGNGPNGFVLFVTDTASGASYVNSIHALALKCAWIPKHEPFLFCAVPVSPPAANYPDDWLIGNVSFSDGAWIIDPIKNIGYFIGTLADKNGSAIDAENISVAQNGAYALFMNKKDLSLWSLQIAQGSATTAP